MPPEQPEATVELPSPDKQARPRPRLRIAIQQLSRNPGLELHPRAARYESLDMWRGIACLLVVVFHTTLAYVRFTGRGADIRTAHSVGEFLLALTGYLWIGVPIFFVISGYCISATADSARRRGLPVSDYFRRRFRRIFPPYWAAMALQILLLLLVDVWVLPGTLSNSNPPILRPWNFSASQWLGNLFLVESWRFHLGGDIRGYILGQSWTLAYEEQFYAVTGIILILASRSYFRAALIVTLVTLVVKHAAGRLGLSLDGWFFDGRWLMFASGILLYYVRNYGRRGAGLVGASVLLLGFLYALHGRDVELTAALAFSLVLLWLHRWDGRIMALPALRPFAFLGTICYSLYLTHAPIVRAMSQLALDRGVTTDWAQLLLVVPLSTAAAILVGWGFYMSVERRFLNVRRV